MNKDEIFFDSFNEKSLDMINFLINLFDGWIEKYQPTQGEILNSVVMLNTYIRENSPACEQSWCTIIECIQKNIDNRTLENQNGTKIPT